MPDTREIELWRLVNKAFQNSIEKFGDIFAKDVTRDLLANGVTVQEEAKLYWKPVKPGEWNLTCSACDSHLGCREGAKFCPECGAKFVYPKALAPSTIERRMITNELFARI